jgi:hypothetical protein
MNRKHTETEAVVLAYLSDFEIEELGNIQAALPGAMNRDDAATLAFAQSYLEGEGLIPVDVGEPPEMEPGCLDSLVSEEEPWPEDNG